MDEPKNVEKYVTDVIHRFLTFKLNNEAYAIPLAKVREVIALGELTPVPHTPKHFAGIMNLRGQVISVIDLRLKFQMPRGNAGSETAVIILDLNPLCIGIIIDSVESVQAIPKDQVSPPPDIESSVSTDYIIGVAKVQKQLILILDIEKSLSVEDLKTIKTNIASRKVA